MKRKLDMSEEYITGLIERMITNEDMVSSDKSIKFKAYREAEKLTNTAFYPILKKLLSLHAKGQDKKYRDAVYFIMGKLLEKVPENECIIFYSNQLKMESDKYILSAMLDRISNIVIPQGISIETIVT